MKKQKLIPIIAATTFLIFIAGLIVIMAEQSEPSIQPPKHGYPPVSVMKATVHHHRPVLTLFGTTFPRWQSEVKAQTTGKVTWLDVHSEPGVLVPESQTLVRLDNTALQAGVASAFSAVKQAELTLERELHEQTVAVKMLSSQKAPAYARRIPQLAAAKADLQQAKKLYENARKQLNDAVIKAPFDAIILSRQVNPSQFVETGQTVFEVASSHALDIRVPVPAQDWNQLRKILPETNIEVVSQYSHRWPASVRYLSPRLDRSTRQRQLILTVHNPYEKKPYLLMHQQVRVHIQLAASPLAMKIPATALTRDGQVWTVNKQNQLVREEVTMLEEQQAWVWVVFARDPQRSRNLVVYPLLSMLPGQQVTPEVIQPEVAE
ncbi:efflux RND transporter periplasmic adaptor subunit [Vibrio quintilis]|uniref:Putative efflux pump membrane fusion protein n=1 Tax=Vibrio quintilis TaxID=1117707 RepID=A0A1M7YRU1_9VIBR|nr:efflux RND transporter periplasmic adaptor subunit [Vibrio quintilis]SHO55275.1 putative efflux pump membrane fusion protein [Vibrio quintilis]